MCFHELQTSVRYTWWMNMFEFQIVRSAESGVRNLILNSCINECLTTAQHEKNDFRVEETRGP